MGGELLPLNVAIMKDIFEREPKGMGCNDGVPNDWCNRTDIFVPFSRRHGCGDKCSYWPIMIITTNSVGMQGGNPRNSFQVHLSLSSAFPLVLSDPRFLLIIPLRAWCCSRAMLTSVISIRLPLTVSHTLGSGPMNSPRVPRVWTN